MHWFTSWQAAKSLGEIGLGNQKAMTALVNMVKSTDVNDIIFWEAIKSLGKIGFGDKKTIISLKKLLQSNFLDDYTRMLIASSLGLIDPDDEKAITTLVQMLQSNHVNHHIRREVASSLEEIIQDNNHRFAVIKTLSSYWRLNGEYYDLVWNCAQYMPYPDFCKAWHQHNFVTRTM